MKKNSSNSLSHGSEERPQDSQDQWAWIVWIIQELFIDVFSRLGAGIIFLLLASLALVEPADVWLRTYSGTNSGLKDFIKSIAQEKQGNIPLLTDTDLPLFLTIAMFFLAVLAGLVFSRLDIKTPDRLSFQRRAKCIWWDYLRDKDREEIENLKRNNVVKKLIRTGRAITRFLKIAVRYIFFMHLFDDFPQHYKDKDNEIKKLFIKELMCTCKADCEYPYFYLKKYLKIRGYECLADMVPWDGPSDKRSRDFITLLKLRNGYYYNREGMMHIAHNEAVIRMLSSVWWVARTIIWISLISIIFMICHNYDSECLKFFNHLSTSPITVLLDFLSIIAPLPALALIAAALLRWGITNQLHDLRMREVFYILAAAYTMSHHNPTWFDDIPELKGGFKQTTSKSHRIWDLGSNGT